MAMIGEQFEVRFCFSMSRRPVGGGLLLQDLSQQICGAVVNVRSKGDKVSLWTRDAANDDANRRIGEILKKKLSLSWPIYYESHYDAKNKKSSNISHLLCV